MFPVYLIAHYAKSQLWHASTLLFGFFLTELCGIDARSMGWIMAASLLLNALADLVMGMWGRSRITDEAHARRVQALGGPLTCAFFLLFCATPFVAADVRSAWALAMLLGFRASYPLIDIPQNTLPALLSLDDHARCTLLANRNVASGVATIAVSVIAAPILIRGGDTNLWMVWALVLSLFVCGAACWLARAPMASGTLPRYAPVRPQGDLGFATILCALAMMIAASAAFRLVEPYYSAFVSGGAGLLLWAAVGGTISQPLWAWRRRRRSAVLSLVAAAVTLAGSAALLLSPLRSASVGAALAGMTFGIGSGGLWLMLWSAMTALAAQGRATRYVGIFTCVSKTAQAAAIVIAGHMLAASPYRLTMRDPWSPPSLMMTGALAAIAVVCLALAIILSINRKASGGKSTTRRRAVPTVQAQG
ncbi:MFS transporter [Brevundimonas sp. SORGH_AS_0993]|uniref:MFS transporter n=1 Tax=Brevundimonas sp. SORGH_AS_0993 TaxID=3041794 RepID=UPI0027802A3F|nr:MFS transporter [Brevundimonas sp. SORGH_AS_0993]MDQ1154383.1 GPH family glycoside/pentoside/hexuronide:cation symporter [Brevundimonas sp. SORGH_AS_0993]